MYIPDWLGALAFGLPGIVAPLPTWIRFKIGTPITVMVGVVIFSTSLFVASLLTNITAFAITYGLISALGSTLIEIPPFFLINEYFPYEHPHHVLVTGMIVCSHPLGRYALTTY